MISFLLAFYFYRMMSVFGVLNVLHNALDSFYSYLFPDMLKEDLIEIVKPNWFLAAEVNMGSWGSKSAGIFTIAFVAIFFFGIIAMETHLIYLMIKTTEFHWSLYVISVLISSIFIIRGIWIFVLVIMC